MKMKTIILILSLIVIYGCDNPLEQNPSKLLISFKNNSAYKLNNLLVSDKLVGNLLSNSSSSYISFDNFTFDTGMPDENASAEVNGKIITNHYRGYWCGTEKITIDSGRYLVEVEILDTLLYLSCKNSPRIDYP